MAQKTKQFEKELIFNNKEYIYTFEITAELIDNSFDHEFGTESAQGVQAIEIETVNLWSVKYEKELIGTKLISEIKDSIDINEYTEFFDYDEFH
jgi:hypothetical protein